MDELSEFLSQKKEEEEKNANKGEDVRSEWITSVEKLFMDIESWTEDARKNRLINISRDMINLSEKNIGNYQIQRLKLESLGRTIIIQPVARYVVASEGLVNIMHGGEVYNLIRKRGEWSITRQSQGTVRVLEDFNKASFTKLLKSII